MTERYSFIRLTRDGQAVYVRLDRIEAVLPKLSMNGAPPPGAEIVTKRKLCVSVDETVEMVMARMVALSKEDLT